MVLENEAYGFDVLKVREIIRCQKITPVPQLPNHVRGVINLRGRVIAVVDLRLKFGLQSVFTERTCIIVVQVQRDAPMGLIVDSVEEVATLTASDIEPTPEFGSKIDTAYLLGIAKVKDQVKILLDIDRVVSGETLSLTA